jgi:hypothetical protein
MRGFLPLLLAAAVGCGGGPGPAPRGPATPPPPARAATTCDATQAAISRDADARARPWSIARHLAKHFPDGRISWLMPEAKYQEYVVKPAARRWGRCTEAASDTTASDTTASDTTASDTTRCYLFAAPAAILHDLVRRSMRDGRHDPAALGKSLGLPAASLEGPLRMMTLDIDDAGICVRLPVDDDPGAWKCETTADTDCFKFGGYTSGGVPELMVLDAPVDRTAIEQVP